MIYFENASSGKEGFNAQLMSYTVCVSLSNLLERDFCFACEFPSQTPPDYAVRGGESEWFRLILDSPRSLLTDLVKIPSRRVTEVNREIEDRITFTRLESYFVTTERLKAMFENTIVLQSFGVGRVMLTVEDLQRHELIECIHWTLTSPSYFYFLEKAAKRELLQSVRIEYLPEVEAFAEKIRAEFDDYYATHIRLGDFREIHGSEYDVEPENFKAFVEENFIELDRPVLVATDALHEKEILKDIFGKRTLIFIDEFVFDEFYHQFSDLPFTDFNVLTVVNQLLCANAELFIGTFRSTMSAIIHRLRQERFNKKDFIYFPDSRVARLVGQDQKLAPDRSGFFDWNRYSAFSESHSAMAWGREWDFDLTVIDL